MDDIAGSLGVSKKTLYQYFDNKADLVYKTMATHLTIERENITAICGRSLNSIDEMFEISKYVTVYLRKMKTSSLFDIQKYYPATWDLYMAYKDSFIYDVIHTNIQKGIEQGLYRSDIQPAIVAKLYSAKSESVVDGALFPFTEYAIIDVYQELLNYHIRGIASDKGRAYLENLKSQA